MDENQPLRVELYVRSLAPCGARETQEETVERLLALERDGVVDEVDLRVWGNAVCLDGASARVGAGAAVAERIDAFQEWCADRRASLEPHFTRTTVQSSLTDEVYDRVVPPHRCLAVFVDDGLREVYPATVDGRPRSVADGLRDLERRNARESVVVGEELD